MKSLPSFRLLMLATFVSLLSSALKTIHLSTTVFSDLFIKQKAEVKAAIRSAEPQPLVNPAKMFTKGNFLFVNEIDKGVHILDISDFNHPVNLAFINIPGCEDLAVRGHYLYADCYTDLVSVDISNPADVKLASFQEGVFPARYYSGFAPAADAVVTEWVRVDTVVKGNYEANTGGDMLFFDRGISLSSYYSAVVPSSKSGMNGTGGSLARFALFENWLYTVSHNELNVFNTSEPSTPAYLSKVAFDRGDIETIFPYNNNLFIGSQTGVHIYSLSNPTQPAYMAEFTHIRSCDPVIADGNYAYVTLRAGSMCGSNTNQLDVLDITNLNNPSLVVTKPMTYPAGLAKDGRLLIVCDGNDGLRFLDADQSASLPAVSNLEMMNPYDVLALGGKAVVTSPDGLYFVDYGNAAAPKILTHLQVEKPEN